jgi:subtilisin-like proprotein convertase family protein
LTEYVLKAQLFIKELNTMKQNFTNNTPITISPGEPNVINSSIEVSAMDGPIRDLNVTIDIDHSWTADLEITLISPGGQRVLLVTGQGAAGDHFRETTFDDAATVPIEGAMAPFNNTFRPKESLAQFNDLDANGTWVLKISDQALADGGSLNHWSISIETCCYQFSNRIPVRIPDGPPSTVSSSIDISDLAGLIIDNIKVTVNIDHTWDEDLSISLIGPTGYRVILADLEGGNSDGFIDTLFDDDAVLAITEGSAPFTGPFRPEGKLSDMQNSLVNGIWTLEVTDNATQDGGWLNSWSLDIKTRNATLPATSDFNIAVRFTGGLTANQRAVFELAAARWAEIIIGDLPSVEVNGEIIDDVLIEAEGTAIDGRGSILGQAGPTHLRPGTILPARGIMSFDTADLAAMEADNTLVDVITHEMAHVLGIGTIWSRLGLLDGAGSINPTFIGSQAMQEYGDLTGTGISTAVPVANTGGPGTRDGHWRELVFGNELMSGFIKGPMNPISRVSIAAFEDMGYQVNYNAAEDYILPSALRLAELGVTAAHEDHAGHGIMFFPDQTILPESAMVDE